MQCLADGVEEMLLQYQVLGRVAADHELGGDQQLCPGLARSLELFGDQPGVAVDVAHRWVDLGEGEA
jgi:hypothetical protein